MRIIFHPGPHKTATTAIQELLTANREALMQQGVFVPNSRLLSAGFHELPWAILGWDTRLLFKGARNEQAENILAQELRSADEAECHTIIFSAEDLSNLNEAQWEKIFTQCRRFGFKDPSVETQIIVTFTKRGNDELVASAYPTLVILGIHSNYLMVKRAIKRSFETRYQRMSNLAALDQGVRVEIVDYLSSSFLPTWFSQVIPDIPVSSLVRIDARSNQRPNPKLVSKIRRLNRRLKLKFSKNSIFAWPTFQTFEVLTNRQEMVQKLVSESPK